MASPQPAEANRALNPHQNARYVVRLSDRITNPAVAEPRFKTVKFNHKPQDTAKVRTTTIKPSTASDATPGDFALSIQDRDAPNASKPSTYEYTGQRRELKKTYVLLFDKDSQSCTLEPLEETYAFNLKKTPWEQDSEKLSKLYPQVRPRREAPDASANPAADDADDGLFSDASDTQSLSGSLLGGASDEEEPEEGNPYDFRHFLKQAEQSEGFASPNSQSGTPLRTTTAPSRTTPLLQPERPKATQPLKPAPKAAAKQTAAAKKEKTAATKPKAAPASKAEAAATSKSQATPAIRLDRRASTRPTDSNSGSSHHHHHARSLSSLSSSAPAAAPAAAHAAAAPAPPSSAQTSSKATGSSRTSREPTPDDESDDDPLGGLEIDWGGAGNGASASRGRLPRRSIALAFEQGVTGDGPVSLRSAADSASPNSRLHTPSMRAQQPVAGGKQQRDVIEFDVGAGSDDEEEEEEDVDEDEVEERHGRQQEDDGYAEEDDEDADGDVEPMNLGSPATGLLQQQQQEQQSVDVELEEGGAEEEAGEDDDDDGMDDLEDDFEAEITQALASAHEEEYAQAESEEESEEE